MSWFNAEYRVGLTEGTFVEHLRDLLRVMDGNSALVSEFLYASRRAVNETVDELFQGDFKLVPVQENTMAVSVYVGKDWSTYAAIERHREVLDRLSAAVETLMQVQWDLGNDLRQYMAANKINAVHGVPNA